MADAAPEPDATICDQDLKRCVQCRVNNHCNAGDACNRLTERCAKACERNTDCAGDSQHSVCNLDLGGVCVACNGEADCSGSLNHCYWNECVQCLDSRDCMGSQSCMAGRCVK